MLYKSQITIYFKQSNLFNFTIETNITICKIPIINLYQTISILVSNITTF